MSTQISYNGSIYFIPSTGDQSWGDSLTAYLIALSTGSLSHSGGIFQLTGDLNFGSTNGIVAEYFSARNGVLSSNIATAGSDLTAPNRLRLGVIPNATPSSAVYDAVAWRNNANTSDLRFLPKAGSETILTYGGIDLVDVSSPQTLTNKIIDGMEISGVVLQNGTAPLTANWAAGSFSATFNSVVVGSAANTVSGLATIVNSGTLTLPTSTDTLVGRNTTDTLTNKTLSAPTITGQLQLASGSANIPAYSFTGNGNVGMYNVSGTLGLATNGLAALTINSSQVATFTSTIGATNFSGSSSGTNTGDATLGTANGLSLAAQVLSLQAASTSTTGALTSTDWNTFNSKAASGNYITALTGDGTASGPNSAALTLATVNSNTGAFGSSTAIPTLTVNGKGLITAVSTNVVIAPAGTLSGTALNATVVSSSLTSVGTLANLTVTNPISGSVTGNAATVTTNANLTGPVTSVGNATTIGSGQVSDANLAVSYIKADGTRGLTGNWAAGAHSATFNSVVVGSAANTISSLSTIVNTGTLTLPTATDTLVARATTDTLTNKTISGASNTVSSPIVGLVGGTAPAAGQIGEQMISSLTTNTNTAATATYFDARSITFTPGTWDIQGCIQYAASASVLTGGSEAGIGTTTGNSNAGEIDTVNWSNTTANPNSNENQTVLTPVWRVTISTSTTYFLKGLINFSAGQPQYKATLRGTRVA